MQTQTNVGTTTPLMTEAERNKAFIVKYIEALSGEAKTEVLMREFTTSEALIEHVREFEAAFPRYELLIDDLIAEGNKAALRVRARGRHEGEFAGLTPTGRQMEAAALVFYRLSGGKIAEFWIQADMLGLLEQLRGS